MQPAPEPIQVTDDAQGNEWIKFSDCFENVSAGSVFALLDFIGAPDDLRCIAPVLDTLRLLSMEVSSFEQIPDVTHVVELLGVSVFLDVNVISSIPNHTAESWRDHRLHTLCVRHPFYAALLAYQKLDGNEAARRHYLAGLCIGFWVHCDSMREGHRRGAGLAYRAVFEDVADNTVLKELTASALSLADLAEELREKSSDAKINEQSRFGTHLRRLQGFFLGKFSKYPNHSRHRSGLRVGGHGIRGEKVGRAAPGDTVILEEETDTRPAHVVRELTQADANQVQARAARNAGLDSRDQAVSKPYAEETDASGIATDIERDPVRRALRARNLTNHLARSNLCLPTAPEMLTRYESYVLFQGLSCLAVAPMVYGVSGVHLAAVVATMFYRSAELEEVLKLRWSSWGRRDTAHHVSVRSRGGLWEGEWHVAGIVPAQGSVVGYEGHADGTWPTDNRYTLPLPPFALAIFAQLVRGMPKRPVFGPPVIPCSAEVLHVALDQWLSDLKNRHPGTQVSQGRISRHLRRRAQQHPGMDLVETDILFGRDSYIASTQLHYTAVGVGRLQESYSRLTAEVEREIEEERLSQDGAPLLSCSCVPSQRQMIGFVRNQARVGSRIVPRDDEVKKLSRCLQEECKQAARCYSRDGDFIGYHNAYASYNLLSYYYGTGARVVTHPFSDPRALDAVGGLLCLSDKDRSDGYSTRIQFVPSLLVEQNEHYFRHLDRLRVVLAMLNADSAQTLTGYIDEWATPPSAMRRSADRRLHGKFSPFFLIDPKGRLSPITPREFRRIIRPIFPHPVNSHRGFLRSKLVEVGIATEHTDAFLGHWVTGREPFRSNSCMSPVACAGEIRVEMEQLLRHCGFKVLHSAL